MSSNILDDRTACPVSWKNFSSRIAESEAYTTMDALRIPRSMEMSKLADLISRRRKELKMSLADVATASRGLSKSYIHVLEQGKFDNPSTEKLVMLARGLRLPVSDVLDAAGISLQQNEGAILAKLPPEAIPILEEVGDWPEEEQRRFLAGLLALRAAGKPVS